jgi:hypothetical protein
MTIYHQYATSNHPPRPHQRGLLTYEGQLVACHKDH